VKRFILLCSAYLFLGLAILGVFLPLLPTVPFLLLSAWCAARTSKKLHAWLYAHPVFGRMLVDWDREGAIARKTKILAVAMLVASWVILYLTVGKWYVLAVVSCVFLSVSIYIVSRPEPRVDNAPNKT